MNAPTKFRLLFTDAGKAYDAISKEKGVTVAFTTFFFVLLAVQAITTTIQLLLYSVSSLPDLWPDFAIQNIVLTFVMSIIIPFIMTLVIHPVALLFGARGIANTFKILTYSLIPFIVFNMIPVVGQLSLIISIFLASYGMFRVHNLSPFKSGLVIAIPLLTYYIAASIFGAITMMQLGI